MYLLSSIKEAESLSNKGLRQDLNRVGVYCAGWDRASLVSTWLAKFGTMLAYHWLKEDMTAGNGNEPAWTVGEERSVKGKLIICKHGYHSSPSPAEGLLYLPGPMLCLVEITGELPQTDEHKDKYVSRTRKLLKVVDMSSPLRLLMCDIADAENAHYEKETSKKVPEVAIKSVLAGRAFANGEITAEEMKAANSALSSSYSSSSSYYSYHYSYYSYSRHPYYSYYSYSSPYYSSSSYYYPRYPDLMATFNRLALEALGQ